jgi:hypothetical protein
VKRPPFVMKPSRSAALTCDGKFVVAGRASFVWETFLHRRVSGVPGEYAIRADQGKPWHRLDWTMNEAEEALRDWYAKGVGRHRVPRMLKLRESRRQRGLPVG